MIKKLIFLIILSAAVLFHPKAAKAWAPDIYGYVKTVTGAPISGVWVKWTDSVGNIRFTQSDSNGYFLFVDRYFFSAEQLIREYNTNIDTDLNGINDARLVNTQSHLGFGCRSNPHVFTAVKPFNVSGTFSQPTKFLDDQPLNINNGVAARELVDIIFYPANANSPYTGVTKTPLGGVSNKPVSESTPSVPISCACKNLSLTGNLGPGSTINIKVTAGITGDYKLGSVIFHVFKNGYEIAASNPIAMAMAGGGNYTANWTYQLPSEQGEFVVFADYSCDSQNLTEFTSQYIYNFMMSPTSYQNEYSLKLGTFQRGGGLADYKIGCNLAHFVF